MTIIKRREWLISQIKYIDSEMLQLEIEIDERQKEKECLKMVRREHLQELQRIEAELSDIKRKGEKYGKI